MDPDAEVVATFDAHGQRTGAAPRRQVYDEGLWHASAGVVVRSVDRTQVYVHQRTDTKAVFPGALDCVAGGVVDADEPVEDTARRELAEELGITSVSLRHLVSGPWQGDSNGAVLRCHLTIYECCYDGPVIHQRSEIADGWWWPLPKLRRQLSDPTSNLAPDTRAIIAGYL